MRVKQISRFLRAFLGFGLVTLWGNGLFRASSDRRGLFGAGRLAGRFATQRDSVHGDDLGYETLSSYGSASYQTPELDRLAESGVRFTHAYAQPLCTPSRVRIRDDTLVLFTGDTGTSTEITSEMVDGTTIVGDKGRPTDAGTRVPSSPRGLPRSRVAESRTRSSTSATRGCG